MSRVRVCIYGGTDLDGTSSQFITELAYSILSPMPAVIVTGGFLHPRDKRHMKSTDAAALEGARRYAQQQAVDLKDQFEAWIPELDSRPDVGEAERMTEQLGITIRVMMGKTPLGRRLAMVAGVDIVVTISGQQHTEVVVEQALELGVPVLPIPDAGGDSSEMLRKHGKRVAAAFEAGAFDPCLRKLSETIANNPKAGASAVVELIKTAKLGKCLVLLPYDEQHNELYTSTIEPSIGRHMIPIRLDRLPTSEAIYTSFGDAIRSSSTVLADITLLNENVMYELGYAHALGLTPLIYTREPARLDQLPVYFRTLNVRVATQNATLETLIDEYLRSFKAKRKVHQLVA